MRHSGKVRKNGRKGVKRKTTDLSLDVYTIQLSVRTPRAAFTGAESDRVY